MTKAIATLSRTKQICDTYGVHPKKGYGQNFLIEENIAKAIAETCQQDDLAIEIGPGIGSLTQQLSLVCKQVLSYEVDNRLLPILDQELKEYNNIKIIHKDFLLANLEEDIPVPFKQNGSICVCANLPYNITTPVLFKLFESPLAIPQITVMVQKEVADRFLAGQGSPSYGAISVESGFLYSCQKIINVSKNCFYPSPKIDSTVIQFQRKSEVDDINHQEFFNLVKTCFHQRRKTLYNNLKEAGYSKDVIQEWLSRAQISEGCRAQELSVEEFCRLYKTK